MPEYELSAGDYPGMKYWSIARTNNRLVIKPGRVPWGSILLVEVFVGGLGFAMLRFVTEERLLFALMCFPIGLAVLGCFLLPVFKIRTERAKGDILAYDADRQLLRLPRERLSLPRKQIVEFKILQEHAGRGEPETWTDSSSPRSGTRGHNGAAELQVVYRNPSPRYLTLLRVCGARPFDDVVAALKAAGFEKIVLVQQQASQSEWQVSQL